MTNPLAFLNPAHTSITSSIDKLTYRRGGMIEAHLQLPPEHQEEFEKRVEALKLQRMTAMDAAHEAHCKGLRALFVEFGQIAAEPPVELTRVVSKYDEPTSGVQQLGATA